MLSEHWKHAQEEELSFWGDCGNTLGEELKQLIYAKHMGLDFHHNGNSPYNISLPEDLSILDIGAGPTSLLLKTGKLTRKVMADPCPYPEWVYERYARCDIEYFRLPGENLIGPLARDSFDEVWMYNVLQHVHDPTEILGNIVALLKPGGVFRIFDWVESEINDAHPHSFDPEELEYNIYAFGFHGELKVIDVNENTATGKALAGWVVKEY